MSYTNENDWLALYVHG